MIGGPWEPGCPWSSVPHIQSHHFSDLSKSYIVLSACYVPGTVLALLHVFIIYSSQNFCYYQARFPHKKNEVQRSWAICHMAKWQSRDSNPGSFTSEAPALQAIDLWPLMDSTVDCLKPPKPSLQLGWAPWMNSFCSPAEGARDRFSTQLPEHPSPWAHWALSDSSALTGETMQLPARCLVLQDTEFRIIVPYSGLRTQNLACS